jgi:hypothetical protein
VHLSLQKAKAAYRDTYEQELYPLLAEEVEAMVWKTILTWAEDELEDAIGDRSCHSFYQHSIYGRIVSSDDINELVASILLEEIKFTHWHSGPLPCPVFNDDELWLECEGDWIEDEWKVDEQSYRKRCNDIKTVCKRCSMTYILNDSCRVKDWEYKDARRFVRRVEGKLKLNYITEVVNQAWPGKIPDIAKVIDRSRYVQSFRKLDYTERYIIEKHIYKSVFLLLFYFGNRNIVAMLTDGESLELGILYFLIRKVIPIPLRKEYIQNGYLYNYCNETSQWRVKRRVQQAYRQHCLL